MENSKATTTEQDPSLKGSTEAANASLLKEAEMTNIDVFSDTPMSDEETNVPMIVTTSGEDLDATIVPNKDNSPNRNTDQGTGLTPENKPKRLCGAAKRRLKTLILKGHTYEEARRLATVSKPQPTPKRQRSDGSTPETKDSHRAKKHKQRQPNGEKGVDKSGPTKPVNPNDHPMDPSPLDYRKTLTGIRQGIILENFPADMMTAEQIDQLQDYIMEQVLGLEDAGFTPVFHGSATRQGWLMVTCANEPTAKWLQTAVGSFKPWEGATLRALDEELLPKAVVLTGYFPHSTGSDTEKILRLIKIQNENIDPKEWKVLNRIEEGKSVLLAFLVDAMSAQYLKQRDYILNYRFSQVRLRTRGSTKSKAEAVPANNTTTTKPQPTVSGTSQVNCPRSPKEISSVQARVKSSRQARTDGLRMAQAGHTGDVRPTTSGTRRVETAGSTADNHRAARNKGLSGKLPAHTRTPDLHKPDGST